MKTILIIAGLNLSVIAQGQNILNSTPRSLDGHGNNQQNPEWGAAHTPLFRASSQAYEDNSFSPSGEDRANPRHISNIIHIQKDLKPNELDATDFVWIWGQFLDHDITLTETTADHHMNIKVPQWDVSFDPFGEDNIFIPMTRSIAQRDSNNIMQQRNDITAFIDASNVYGSDTQRAQALRSNDGSGKLKTSSGDLLPFNIDRLPNAPDANNTQLFLAGDVRANEQIGLTAMHTIFVREHNFLVDLLSERFPSLNGEDLYQAARHIVIGEMQHITYNEFLPFFVQDYNLPDYRGYDPQIFPGIANEFSTAAFRVGHTMLSPNFALVNSQNQRVGLVSLKEAFFRPQRLQEQNFMEMLLRGFASNRAQAVDVQLVDEIRNFLFGEPGRGGLDLAALNIQRGRDHGLPHYNKVRSAYGLARRSSWESIAGPRNRDLINRFFDVYASSFEVDPWTGMLAEPPELGLLVGETVEAVLADQFSRLRAGDRFWYSLVLNDEWIEWVERQTLSTIITRNTNIQSGELPRDVFRLR